MENKIQGNKMTLYDVLGKLLKKGVDVQGRGLAVIPNMKCITNPLVFDTTILKSLTEKVHFYNLYTEQGITCVDVLFGKQMSPHSFSYQSEEDSINTIGPANTILSLIRAKNNKGPKRGLKFLQNRLQDSFDELTQNPELNSSIYVVNPHTGTIFIRKGNRLYGPNIMCWNSTKGKLEPDIPYLVNDMWDIWTSRDLNSEITKPLSNKELPLKDNLCKRVSPLELLHKLLEVHYCININKAPVIILARLEAGAKVADEVAVICLGKYKKDARILMYVPFDGYSRNHKNSYLHNVNNLSPKFEQIIYDIIAKEEDKQSRVVEGIVLPNLYPENEDLYLETTRKWNANALTQRLI